MGSGLSAGLAALIGGGGGGGCTEFDAGFTLFGTGWEGLFNLLSLASLFYK